MFLFIHYICFIDAYVVCVWGVCGDQELVLGIEFRLWPSVRCRHLPSHLTHDLLVVTSKAAGMLLVFMVVFAHHVLLQLGECLFLGVHGQEVYDCPAW